MTLHQQNAAPSIILVDDNVSVSEEICFVLQKAGWNVRCADDADALREMLAQQVPDTVLLDLNLPGEDGISVCKWLRMTYPDLGVAMLTARVMGSERSEGYMAGADVYLTKPTRPEELVAVLRNLTNRLHRKKTKSSSHASWSLQLKGMRLISPQSDILSLSHSECVLLRELALKNRHCTYQQLIDKLDVDGVNEKSGKARLEVLVSRLRAKLVIFEGEQFAITTLHGVGYQLNTALIIQQGK